MTVSIHSNAKMYGLRMRQRAQQVTPEIVRAQEDVARQAVQVARKLSSGPYKQATLTSLGHPYSRRHPRAIGSMYPAVVNVQSGAFRAAWQGRVTQRASRAKGGGTNVTAVLSNDSPEARYLTAKGTYRMVGRPILQAIVGQMRAPVAKRHRLALTRALSVGAVGSMDVLGAGYGGPRLASIQSAFRRGYAAAGILGA